MKSFRDNTQLFVTSNILSLASGSVEGHQAWTKLHELIMDPQLWMLIQ